MSSPTPQLRRLAERLIAHEAQINEDAGNASPAGFDICDQLRPPLAMLMGGTGFRALLSRALVLAAAEVQWLRGVHVKAEGSLEGLDELGSQVDAKALAEGKVALMSQLLALLTTFIGEDLTLGLVREVWPSLSLEEMDSGGRRKA